MNISDIKNGEFYTVKHPIIAPGGNIYKITINSNKLEITAARFQVESEMVFPIKGEQHKRWVAASAPRFSEKYAT